MILGIKQEEKMAGTLKFTRDYAVFGSKVNDYEISPDVNHILAGTIRDFTWYPYDVYIGSKFVAIWLREGEKDPNDPANIDLIFIAKNQGYAEIVLRDHNSEAAYGGWLVWGESAEVTDEIVNGYRVINVTLASGDVERHEFVDTGYVPVGPTATASLARAKRGTSNR